MNNYGTTQTKEEFEEVEKAILFGDALDGQILSIAKRFPTSFHIAMIPDLKQHDAELADAIDPVKKELLEAERAKWESEMRLFKTNLKIDWKTISSVEVGSEANLGRVGSRAGILARSRAHIL